MGAGKKQTRGSMGKGTHGGDESRGKGDVE